MKNEYLYSLGQIEQNTRLVLSTYLPSTYSRLEPNITTYFGELNRLLRRKGPRLLIQKVKDSRVAVLRQLTGNPIMGVYPVPLDRGYPSWLPFSRVTRRPGCSFNPSQLDEIRLILTLLSCLRGIILEPVLDLDTVTKPYGGLDSAFITDAEVTSAVRRLGVKGRNHSTTWQGFHFTTKSGPMGPALLSSVLELPLILNNLQLLADIKLIGGERLAQVLEFLRSVSHLVVMPKSPHLSRLAIFGDKEAKTRIVAIFDYWSQTCLFPIHRVLMKLLKGIKNDCTFNQSNFEHLSKLPGPFYSFDLSAATDRMPMWLQFRVISNIIGKQKAEAWVRLLTSREFAVQKLSTPVKYGCGQPMGAYSSWASMAFTHHVIVQLSAMRIGKDSFSNYALLGDDIVIADSAVAESYRLLLSQLDMGISSVKTHVSYDSWEFAKRWFISKSEVTPFSIGGLKTSVSKYFTLSEFLSNQASHGWSLLEQQVPGLVTSLLRIALSKSPSRNRRIQGYVTLFSVFTSVRLLYPKMGTRILEGAVQRSVSLNKLRDAFLSMGLPASGLTPFNFENLVSGCLGSAQLRAVERDLGNFQTHLSEAVLKANEWCDQKLPGADHSTIQPWLPVYACLTTILDRSVASLKKPSILFEDGIAKHYIGKGVFSEDRNLSRLRSIAGVTKLLIGEVQKAICTGYHEVGPRKVWTPELYLRVSYAYQLMEQPQLAHIMTSTFIQSQVGTNRASKYRYQEYAKLRYQDRDTWSPAGRVS